MRPPEQGDVRNAAETRREAERGQFGDILAALKANSGKNFVQRITNAGDWPVMQNADGSYSSHRMGSTEVDGKNIAFPTLVYDASTNALRAPADPVREALNTGEYIQFPSDDAAERFANNGYKVGLNTGLMQQMRQQPSFGDVMKRLLNQGGY